MVSGTYSWCVYGAWKPQQTSSRPEVILHPIRAISIGTANISWKTNIVKNMDPLPLKKMVAHSFFWEELVTTGFELTGATTWSKCVGVPSLTYYASTIEIGVCLQEG